MKWFFLYLLGPALATAGADTAAFQKEKRAIEQMAGCYLVDYSYTETEALKPGYTVDRRVYDVNKDKTVKEWIYAEHIGNKKIRLQHVLFTTDHDGKPNEKSFLKHQAEDWEYGAESLYDFVGPGVWVNKKLETKNLWTRKVTNLDDGLRYQCAAAWDMSGEYPEWRCDNYAPVPGRETRDMGRKDYQTLDRSTRVVVYKGNWLERQNNTKTIHEGDVKTPLAKEVGKNWYVKVPDSECAPVQSFAQKRKPFWKLLRETWDEVLMGDRGFVEKTPPGEPVRHRKIMTLEDEFVNKNLRVASVRKDAKDKILSLIGAYRVETQ